MIAVENYSEREQKAAQRVLDTLDRMDARMEPAFSGRREHRRRNFRALVHLYVPDPNAAVIDPETGKSVSVWGRSLSEAGLSFIHPGRIKVKSIFVGIQLPSGKRTWFQARIVRAREIEGEAFWEYGVTFRARATG